MFKRIWLLAAQESTFARCGQILHDQGPLPSLRQWLTQLLFASWPCRVCNVSQNQNHYQADYWFSPGKNVDYTPGSGSDRVNL